MDEVRAENYDKSPIGRYIHFDDVVCKTCEYVKRMDKQKYVEQRSRFT